MSLIIVRVAIPIYLRKAFDYLLPSVYADRVIGLKKGMRVEVPFGNRQVMGFIVSVGDKTEVAVSRLKPISAILDNAVLLPPVLMQLIEWTSLYYHRPWGEVMELAMPTLLRTLKSFSLDTFNAVDYCSYHKKWEQFNQPLRTLNQEQAQSVSVIQGSFGKFTVFLLEGVTGSGKTEVYFQLIAEALKRNQQVLLLVPEIGLTPQMLGRLQNRFGENMVLSHSRLTDKQRLSSWTAIQSGQKAIMVGTRSVVFSVFQNLGLIIVDEEHDSSFKQQNHVAYHARDVAIMRARLQGVPIVLGSATPSLESTWNAVQKRYHRLTLSQRAGNACLPTIRLLDTRKQKLNAGLSEKLLTLMRVHLEAKQQVLLFLNRRGFSPTYLCHGCGWVMMCSDCDRPLCFHMRPRRLSCHYCEQIVAVPTVCPSCNQAQLFALGQGTQRLEAVLKDYFKGINLLRIDADTTRSKVGFHRLFQSIQADEPTILIGTQMLAKGHHFPGVSLAVVVDGDAGLFGADFRSLEQAAQLIVQVSGRAGRSHQTGEVAIQTHHPHHPLLNQLLQSGYTGFSELALAERKASGWPPFSYLAVLRVHARTQKTGLLFLTEVKSKCMQHPLVSLLGPVPALAAKRAGYYYVQLLFRSKERSALHKVLGSLVKQLDSMPQRAVRYSLEVDPVEVC